ncbi:MAG TPA: TRAP transporter small permease [Acidimicrobiia bacterium]|nr:TRAP transporter small permease [Acidimicrobiia bacterium]
MRRWIVWIRRFNRMTHFVAGAALTGILALTVVDITGRSAFRRPFPGTVELTSMILVVVVFLAVAHSEDMGDHITIDLIYERVSKRWKVFLDIFSDLLTMVVVALLSYQLYQFVLRNQSSGAETPVLDLPMWPFVLVAAVGAAFYVVSTLMRVVLRLMGEPVNAVDPADGDSGGVEV